MTAKKSTKKKAQQTSRPQPIRSFNLKSSNITGTSKARKILKGAHESAAGLIESFVGVRKYRGAISGAPKDSEQDLLRACLVFSAAGLDSTIKQLIRDTLPRLVRSDDNVRKGLEDFIARQTREEPNGGEAASGKKFLAKILVAENHLDALIEQYILSLTGSSLQSTEELSKSASALGLDPRQVGVNHQTLRPIFKTRNKIIHELDINLDAINRNRESRTRGIMVRDSNALLEVGEKILVAVETKLSNNSSLNNP